MDQVFTMRLLSEELVNKGKRLYVAYMYLEKEYDLFSGIKSFYDKSKASVRVCS